MSYEVLDRHYVNHVGSYPLLSAQRERDLAHTIIRTNAGEAREELVRANLRLVVSIALHYSGRGMLLSDLIAEGNVGLMRAVDAFNPEKGLRFATYATWWIKQAIRRALLRNSRAVHIPVHVAALMPRWRRARLDLHLRLEREPTAEEIAAYLEIPLRQAQAAQDAEPLLGRVAQARDGDDWAGAPHELAADERTAAPDENALTQEQIQTLYRHLRRLPRREARIIRGRFGLDDGRPRTLKEIGAELDLTRERVRQLEAAAMDKLRRYAGDKAGAPLSNLGSSDVRSREGMMDDADYSCWVE